MPEHEDAAAPVLELRGITKRFGAVLANDGVSVRLARGEVLGIFGENGAGKSTLMNVLSGLLAPDRGEIVLDGEPVAFRSPRDAIERGIGKVHQHFMLVPTLTVSENLVLGDRGMAPVPLDLTRASDSIEEIGQQIGLTVDPRTKVGDLGVAGRQRVEILKALYRKARILILDEPTAVLSRPESEGLFAMIRKLRAGGVSIILISHKLDDIFAVCDRVTVMRQGRVVEAMPIASATPSRLVRAMVGAEVARPRTKDGARPGEALLVAERISARRDDGSLAFGDASFEIHAGEIVAVAGVEGNGQRELAEVITGLRPVADGRMWFRSIPYGRTSTPRRMRRLGIRHVTEDRSATGILPSQPLRENHLLTNLFHDRFNRLGWLDRKRAVAETTGVIDRYDVVAPGPIVPMRSLSGGNQQKMVLGRELAEGVRLLVAAHPTRGLDVRTIAFIQERFMALRAAGVGVLLISSDLNEIWQVADRLLVLADQRMRGPVPIRETNVGEVGAWMAGRAAEQLRD